MQDRNTDMSVQYEFLGTVRRMKVTSAEATTLQKRPLPEETRQVKIRATGNGLAIIQVTFQAIFSFSNVIKLYKTKRKSCQNCNETQDKETKQIIVQWQSK